MKRFLFLMGFLVSQSAFGLQCYFTVANGVSPMPPTTVGSLTVYRASALGYLIELVTDQTSYVLRAEMPNHDIVEVSGMNAWIPAGGRVLMTFPLDQGKVECRP